MSNNHNLTLDLKKKIDRSGSAYHIGKIKAPITIDCSKGVAFLIFTSEDGSEALQICNMIEKEHNDRDTEFND